MPELETLTLETADNPDAAIIWLHGLGANGHDFVPIVQQLHLPASLAIRFLFPHAPERSITINQGMRMPAWYDVSSLSIVEKEDESGILESSQAILKIFETQVAAGIDASRIILAGFSQGGAIALHCGLFCPLPLAGIMALSTYLPMSADPDDPRTMTNRSLSIFMAHGKHDDVVAINYGKQSAERLQNAGYNVIWKEYPMAHSVCIEEIEAIRDWIVQRLN